MKTTIFSAAICLLILLNVFPASAQVARFVGRWENIDADTRGISAIEITREGDQVAAQIYGACVPTPCVWKKAMAVVHAPNIESNAMNDAVALSLNIDAGFAQNTVILRIMGDRLQAQILTHFTDRSKRTDYYQTEAFVYKEGWAASVQPEDQPSNNQSPNNPSNRGTATFGTPNGSRGDGNLLIGKTGLFPNTLSGSILNGKAISLIKPEYPAAARAVRASGAVNVQVTIDEQGNIISAAAISGHPLLQQAAEQAALGSKFLPTTLEGQPVSVTGIIVYNFAP